MKTRITFRTCPFHSRDVDVWPVCDVTLLTENEREIFHRKAKGIRRYLEDGSLKSAARIARCSGSTLLDSFNRCLKIAGDGRIFGFRALLPHLRTKKYVRNKALPRGRAIGASGSSGAFDAFLSEHPELHQELDRRIERGGSEKGGSAHPQSFKIFEGFVQLCRCYVGPDCYPLNSRSKGRRSVERYIKAYRERHLSCVETWYGGDAAQRLRLGTGHKSFHLGEAPFDVVGFDAHKIHCVGTIDVPGPAGRQTIPIERIWVCVAVDSGCSKAVVGYSIGICTEINAAHVELAIKNCLTEWAPLKLTVQDVSYKVGAGLPVGTVPGLSACRFACLTMDNAAQHFANRIVDSMRRAMGCTIRWGQVGAWWRNSEVERFFKTFEGGGIQSLPSSTGSNVHDPLRDNASENAIAKCIVWEEVLQRIDVCIANYNVTPHTALGGQKPLDVLAKHLSPASRTFVERPSVPITAFTPQLGVTVEWRIVRGDLKLGRRPYIEVDQARYTGDSLSGKFDFVGATVIVHINETDMSSIQAYQENGLLLGTLRPIDSEWRRQNKVPRDLVKAINANIRDAENLLNPLDAHIDDLRETATRGRKKSSKKISRDATRLADALHRTDAQLADPRAATTRRSSNRPAVRTLPPSMPAPTWEIE
ncbi:hypothetical protein ACCC97_19465 [Variovorax sp. Varisp85]|uniref:hypothetical protein n=1 Tax=Variovorax sp. Varisp85 TaxID=3243059 RepID=UPI0039A53697